MASFSSPTRITVQLHSWLSYHVRAVQCPISDSAYLSIYPSRTRPTPRKTHSTTVYDTYCDGVPNKISTVSQSVSRHKKRKNASQTFKHSKPLGWTKHENARARFIHHLIWQSLSLSAGHYQLVVIGTVSHAISELNVVMTQSSLALHETDWQNVHKLLTA